MSEDNLKLWLCAEKTDPHFTKAFSRGGGFKGTAINGTYVAKRLTELFGPCGQGWKIVIEDEKYVTGAPLTETCNAVVHVVRGHLEYRTGDSWHATGPQYGQTEFVGRNKNGVFTDEEAPKKSITDLTGKLAVLLGVSADVHLGRYDDNKYVADLRAEFAPPPETITVDQAKELAELCAKHGRDAAALAKYYEIDSLLSLPADLFEQVKGQIQKPKKVQA